MIATDPPPLADPVTIDDFARLDNRVGTVIAAEPFPAARTPAFKLTINFGPLGRRRSSAQITTLYRPDTLVGRQVLAVVNIPPRRIGPFNSEVLVLGLAAADAAVVLIGPERAVPDGGRLH